MGLMDQLQMKTKNAQFVMLDGIDYGTWKMEGMDFKMENTEEQRHEKLINLLHETYIKKNRDYGDAFGVSLDKRGLIAAIVRMEDKISRLDSLKDQDALVVDESLKDTALDLANYAIMTAMWLERQSEKPMHIYSDNEAYMEVKPSEERPLTPGITLKPNEQVYITNHGSYTLEDNKLITRAIDGHKLSVAEVKEGDKLVLRVVSE